MQPSNKAAPKYHRNSEERLRTGCSSTLLHKRSLPPRQKAVKQGKSTNNNQRQQISNTQQNQAGPSFHLWKGQHTLQVESVTSVIRHELFGPVRTSEKKCNRATKPPRNTTATAKKGFGQAVRQDFCTNDLSHQGRKQSSKARA